MLYRCGLFTLLISLGGCQSSPTQTTSFTNTHWQLRQIDGQPITLPTDQPAPFLWLLGDDYVFHGTGGCNRLGGVYQLKRHQLAFRLFAIKKPCLTDFGQEQHMMQRLEDTTSYRIQGTQLQLRGKDHKTYLLFEAKPIVTPSVFTWQHQAPTPDERLGDRQPHTNMAD